MAPCHRCHRGHITPGPINIVAGSCWSRPPVVVAVVVTSPPAHCRCAHVFFFPPPMLLLGSHHPRPTAIALTSFTACHPCRCGHITPDLPLLRSRWPVRYHHPQLIVVVLRLSPALLTSRAHSIATCRRCAHAAALSLSPAHHCCADNVQDTPPSW
jgi:hypothetical protein